MLIFPAGSQLAVRYLSGPSLIGVATVFGQEITATSQEFKCLGQISISDDVDGSAENIVFTVPAGSVYLVRSLNITNPGTTALGVRCHYLPSAGNSTANSNAISGSVQIMPGGMGVYEDKQGWRFFSKNQSLAGATVIGNGLELLGATVLGANRFSTETVKFTPRDSLLVYVRCTGATGSGSPSLRFNGDSGTNYWSRYLTAAAGLTTLTNSQATAQTFARVTGSSNISVRSSIVYISNRATNTKVGVANPMTGSGSAATAAGIDFGGFEWVNTTDQISEIQMLNSVAGVLNAGSGFEVYGITY